MSIPRLRLIAGPPGAAASLPPSPQLQTVQLSPMLLLQHDDRTRHVVDRNGASAYITGDITGARSDAGDIRGWDVSGEPLSELVATRRVDRLVGRFLCTVQNGDAWQLWSDRFGERDVYIQRVGNDSVCMASSLDLLPISGGGGEIDQMAVASIFAIYGYRPPKRHTPYAGVRRLGVDEGVSISPDGTVQTLRRPFVPAAATEFGERELHEYADTFIEAIRGRGSRDGNLVYLSSGWDSTSILATLVHVFGARKVRAVIGRMRYAERSGVINQFEIDRAQAVAAFFRVPLDIIEFDDRDRGPDLVESVRDEFRAHHFASMTAINHAALARYASRTTRGNEVVFAGEISDGAHNLGFSQYATIFHPVIDFREYSDKMGSYLFGPTFLSLLRSGQFASDPIYQLFRGRAGSAVFEEPGADGGLQLLSNFFLRGNRLPLWSIRNTRILTADGGDRLVAEMEREYLREAAAQLEPSTLYAWYLYLYNSFHWQASTVATFGLTAEMNGLRSELPFYDGAVQDFLSAMPESWGRGLDLKPTKYPLKWMLANRIRYPMHLQVGPHSYLYDVDPSFSHGAELLFGSTGWRGFFHSLLERRQYRSWMSPEVFDLPYVDGFVTRYLSGEEFRGGEMYDLLSLCIVSMIGFYGES